MLSSYPCYTMRIEVHCCAVFATPAPWLIDYGTVAKAGRGNGRRGVDLCVWKGVDTMIEL